MKAKVLCLFSTVLVLLSCGCGTTGKFIYPEKMADLVQVSDHQVSNKVVAVVPFDDFRPSNNDMGSVFFYLIPLMPYGWCTYERPDGARHFVSIYFFDFDMSEDFAKASALSLRRSMLFGNAYFTFGGDIQRAHYIFKGDVYSTEYKGQLFSYGLSLAGPFLWYLGVPSARSTNNISLRFYLTDKETGELLWEYKFAKEERILQFLYYGLGWDVKSYAKLYEQAMNEAIADLHKAMLAKPEKFGLKAVD